MESLNVICLKTDNLVYSYTCEDEIFLSIAEHRANKRFNMDHYRLTTQADYDHTFNKELYTGYEIIGTINGHCSPLEYSGQIGA